MGAPRWLMYMLSFVDKESNDLLPSINLNRKVATNNASKILGMSFESDASKLVKMMAYGAIAAGLIPDKSDGVITSSYVRPEIDLSDVPRAKPL